MEKGKVLTLEDRIPKLKAQRKQRANRRLITYLSFFFLLIMLIIYFQSPLNEIHEINISGNHYLSNESLMDKLALKKNAKFWTTDLKSLSSKLEKMDEIKKVQIKRTFPNNLKINVDEFVRIGYVEKGEKYYPILENGKILDSTDNKSTFVQAPILVNWKEDKTIQMMAKELKLLPNEIVNRISEIIYEPKDSDPYNITLYMNDGNEVRTTIPNFSKRMTVYPSIVEELASKEPGIIHMTVSPWAEKFPKSEQDGEKIKEKNNGESVSDEGNSNPVEGSESTQEQTTQGESATHEN